MSVSVITLFSLIINRKEVSKIIKLMDLTKKLRELNFTRARVCTYCKRESILDLQWPKSKKFISGATKEVVKPFLITASSVLLIVMVYAFVEFMLVTDKKIMRGLLSKELLRHMIA
jgi:hypothetical protein